MDRRQRWQQWMIGALLFCSGAAGARAQSASTFHVFPQIADGTSPDGTNYQSLLLATNVADSETNCTLRLYGLSASRLVGSTSFTIAASGAFTLVPTFGVLFPLASGYATLTCDRAVSSALAYFYARSTTVLAAATVFSSPATRRAQLITNEGGGSRLALAVANDTDTAGEYQVALLNTSGQSIATATLAVAARTSVARFVDQIVQTPESFLGAVRITSSGGAFSLIGLNFVGSTFFTQPAAILDATSSAPDN